MLLSPPAESRAARQTGASGWAPTTVANARRGESLLLEHFTTQDGLGPGEVHKILQDSRGFLWIGTASGLQRFDGYQFTTIEPDPETLGSAIFTGIIGLCEDRDGFIWISSWSALFRFDPSTGAWKHYRPYLDNPRSLSSVSASEIYQDRAGTLWIGTGWDRGRLTGFARGLNRFDRETDDFTRFRHDPADPSSLSHDQINALLEDRSGAFWIGTSNGIDLFDRASGRVRHHLEGAYVTALYEDRSGTVWAGTKAGLFLLEAGAFRAYRGQAEVPIGSQIAGITDLQEDALGNLWIGSENGLWRLDRSTGHITRYVHRSEDAFGLSDNHVNDLYLDRSGMLWIAVGSATSSSKALEKLDPGSSAFTVFGIEHMRALGLSDPRVRALYEDRRGRIWIGTEEDAATVLDPRTGRKTTYPLFGALAFHEDRAGRMWVGMHAGSPGAWAAPFTGGLARLDPETGRSITFHHDRSDSTSLSSDDVIAVTEDRTGTLWIGTRRGGLNRVFLSERGGSSSATFRGFAYEFEGILAPNGFHVNTIFEDRAGRLWVGMRAGLGAFDRASGRYTNFRSQLGDSTSLSHDYVFALHDDSAGNLWIGTHRGLDLLTLPDTGIPDPDHATFRRFSSRNSALPSDVVLGIEADEFGQLWLLTESALVRFDPESFDMKTYGRFGQHTDITNEPGALHRSRDGRLYFGGTGGFVSVSPERLTSNAAPPQVQLAGLSLFGRQVVPSPEGPLRRPLGSTDTLTLAHDQNDLAIDFVALHYRNPAQNQAAYRLDGYDSAWREAGTQRTATYTGLPPGTYTFRVRASNSDGVWNESSRPLTLRILPPWWRTWWADVLYAAALLGLLFFGYAWRTRRLRRHAAELREMVRERTRELAVEQQKTEAQAQRLLALEQTKSRFFANISHEFRTPLTLLLGPLDDLLTGTHGDLSRAARRQLQIMRRNGRRLLRLIQELLDLSKLEVGGIKLRLERRDLVHFLRSAVHSFLGLAERRHLALHFETSADTLPLAFDADKLEKVVTNLLSNAFKFTPEGGQICVGVRPSVRDGLSWGEIRVADSGQGIPKEALPHIFDRFYQAGGSPSSAEAGTGIGLALSRELVEVHGGTIRVESRDGVGTTFFVSLPDHTEVGGWGNSDDSDMDWERVAAEEAGFEEDEGQSDGDGLALDRTRADGERPTILIVEDNADVRAYLTGHLAGRYRVIEAVDGSEGLERARETPPDLVISDVMMPKLDGVALCRALKNDERLNHTPVLLLTAKASEEAELEGLAAGADDYVTKPFGIGTLLARVEKLIEIRRMLRRRFSGEVVLLPTERVVPSDDAVFLEHVREVVEAHLGDEHFTVEWLADEIGLSARQLQRRLASLLNLSPAGFIRMMRLELAACLLEQKAGTVSEIAYRVGFKNTHHFSRLFRQTFGVTPSTYDGLPEYAN